MPMASDRAVAYLLVVLGSATFAVTSGLLAVAGGQVAGGAWSAAGIGAWFFAPATLVVAAWYGYKLTGEVV